MPDILAGMHTIPGDIDIEIGRLEVNRALALWSFPLPEGATFQANLMAWFMGTQPRELWQTGKMAWAIVFLEIGRDQSYGNVETNLGNIKTLWDKLVIKVEDEKPSATVTLADDQPDWTADASLWFDPSKYRKRIVDPEERVPFLHKFAARAGWPLDQSATKGESPGKVYYNWFNAATTPRFTAPRPGYIAVIVEIPPEYNDGDFSDDDRHLKGQKWASYRDVIRPLHDGTGNLQYRQSVATAGTMRERMQRIGKQYVPNLGSGGVVGVPGVSEAKPKREVWKQSELCGGITGSFMVDRTMATAELIQ